MGESVAAAVRRVSARVAAAAERSGRRAEDVTIVAAAKYVEAPAIREVVAAGIHDVGENRAQALEAKALAVDGDVRWHYFGAIQTNKVRLLDRAVLLHGLYREREAQALQGRGDETGRTWDVLVEVNMAGEQAKQGVSPGEVEPLLQRLDAYPRVNVRGFMFMAPQVQVAEDVRWLFAEGRRLRERYSSYGLGELSMGMSEDFEVAVEEGSTIVRIGRSIFNATEGF